MIKLEDKALEVVSGGFGGYKVTQTNWSLIIAKDFNASAKNGSLAGVSISVIQGNSN